MSAWGAGLYLTQGPVTSPEGHPEASWPLCHVATGPPHGASSFSPSQALSIGVTGRSLEPVSWTLGGGLPGGPVCSEGSHACDRQVFLHLPS